VTASVVDEILQVGAAEFDSDLSSGSTLHSDQALVGAG
jgi:hypothetical protein